MKHGALGCTTQPFKDLLYMGITQDETSLIENLNSYSKFMI